MAEQGKQGTGKHGHKDTQEPWPHTNEGKESGQSRGPGKQMSGSREESEESGGRNRSEEGRSSSRQMSGSRDQEEHRGRSQHGEDRSKGGQMSASHGSESGQSEEADLKSREYRDADGNIHHHTRTYMDQHGKE